MKKKKTFEITEKEMCDIITWQDKQKGTPNPPAIGGRWTYKFTPTGIGTMISVVDNETGKELNLDGNW